MQRLLKNKGGKSLSPPRAVPTHTNSKIDFLTSVVNCFQFFIFKDAITVNR